MTPSAKETDIETAQEREGKTEDDLFVASVKTQPRLDDVPVIEFSHLYNLRLRGLEKQLLQHNANVLEMLDVEPLLDNKPLLDKIGKQLHEYGKS
jgi:hypothetical protein